MIFNILIVYTVLMVAGGLYGYKKSGSKVSAIMGIISGGILTLGLLVTNNNSLAGYSIISGMSGILSVVFLNRFLKTKAFMPSGMLLALSFAAMVFAITQLS